MSSIFCMNHLKYIKRSLYKYIKVLGLLTAINNTCKFSTLEGRNNSRVKSRGTLYKREKKLNSAHGRIIEESWREILNVSNAVFMSRKIQYVKLFNRYILLDFDAENENIDFCYIKKYESTYSLTC